MKQHFPGKIIVGALLSIMIAAAAAAADPATLFIPVERWTGGAWNASTALRRDGQGLGRVYDSRYDRNCVDAIKFPLGIWKQGEMRKFAFTCGHKMRQVSLTTLEIDFNFNGVAQSLKFRWTADGGTKRGTNNFTPAARATAWSRWKKTEGIVGLTRADL